MHARLQVNVLRQRRHAEAVREIPPKYVTTELGPEALCARCLQYWPADGEFFYFHGGRRRSCCRACYLEHRAELRTLPGAR